MTTNKRKDRVTLSVAQKLEYAKLMVDENYTNQQIIIHFSQDYQDKVYLVIQG